MFINVTGNIALSHNKFKENGLSFQKEKINMAYDMIIMHYKIHVNKAVLYIKDIIKGAR